MGLFRALSCPCSARPEHRTWLSTVRPAASSANNVDSPLAPPSTAPAPPPELLFIAITAANTYGVSPMCQAAPPGVYYFYLHLLRRKLRHRAAKGVDTCRAHTAERQLQPGLTPEAAPCTRLAHHFPLTPSWLCCRDWTETWKAKRAAWYLLADRNCPVLLVALEPITAIFKRFYLLTFRERERKIYM